MSAVVVERIRVRYGETDQMGHAYYANYLFWFEQARGGWCRAHGFTYRELEERGILLPVVEASVQYKAEVRYDDWIAVRIWVEDLRRASMRFAYEVVREHDGQVAATGFTRHAVWSRETRRTTPMPDWMQALMARDPESTDPAP